MKFVQISCNERVQYCVCVCSEHFESKIKIFIEYYTKLSAIFYKTIHSKEILIFDRIRPSIFIVHDASNVLVLL